ncbi:MAG TPA: AEC family transporter [Xylella sp.]
MMILGGSMIVEVFIRVFFLIFTAALGWGAGYIMKLNSRDISSLLIYIISPFVIFLSILQSPANWTYLGYSLGALLTASAASFLGYGLARMIWKDGRVNLFSFSAGTGNTGYFALPLAFALFNERQIAIAIFIIIGVNIYEFTVGYFIAAKGAFKTTESLRRMLRLPILYAIILGITFKKLDINVGTTLLSAMSNFKGAYSVFGMMVIGVTLASYRKIRIDWGFLMASLAWKHAVYRVVGILVFYLMTPVSMETLAVIVMMLATPMVANTVVIANNLNVYPEKAAFSVMISTFMAVVTVPLAIMWVTRLSG